MKAFLVVTLGAAALSLAIANTTVPADAKGCIKGAVVGGIAGHAAHHGLLGAMAGCAIGHHEANKHAREAQDPQHADPAQPGQAAPQK
jgi:hypothetical protein